MFNQIREFKVHFIGVGGVSMSWLAEYFKELGFIVSGSDRVKSKNLEKLRKKGIRVFEGHDKRNVDDAHVVVFSDAISEDNVELKTARQRGLYILSRGEALSSVAENFGDTVGVAGCHGKTTTTCMIAHIFKCASLKFTAHVGGEDVSLGNFVMQGSDVFLSEVCEFKKNINKFNADYAVCLNTDKDHLDCYDDESELKNAYVSFAKRAYKSIINKNDDVLSKVDLDNSVGFSIDGKQGYTAQNVFNKHGRYAFDLYKDNKNLGRIELSVYGAHNVENALAAATCAIQMGIDFRYVKRGIKEFKGVVRRFEKIGKINGAEIIADYAHHPTEILACLKTAEQMTEGNLYVVFQPHTYSRTVYLKAEFIKVLSKIKNLCLFKTFPARENYKKGGSAYDLHLLIENSEYFDDVDAMLKAYRDRLKRKDVLLILGAGDLYDLIKEKLEINSL